MKKFVEEEIELINSLREPIRNINMDLVNSIIDKLIINRKFDELLDFLYDLHDFAELPDDLVDRLISGNKKECIAYFLDNEKWLFFLNDKEIKELKSFLNVSEINIRLSESYDYYYNMLFKQGVIFWKGLTKKVNDNIIEHECTRYNKYISLKLKEVKNIGVVVSCILYANYNLSEEEQLLKGIDYINEFGFNIDRDINNNDIIINL